VVGLALILFFVWLIIPINNQMALKGGEKPWEEAEQMLPVYGGITLTLALNDTVALPPGGQWKSDVRYERTQDTSVYEPRIYIMELWDDVSTASSSDKVVQANITIQRFRSDFAASVEEERIKNFIWHETKFLKENKIDKRFSYSKSTIGDWQWIVWQDDTKFNLYASCVTKRGRLLLQASAFDVYVLKKFFQYVANTYQEGSLNPPVTTPSSDSEEPKSEDSNLE